MNVELKLLEENIFIVNFDSVVFHAIIATF